MQGIVIPYPPCEHETDGVRCLDKKEIGNEHFCCEHAIKPEPVDLPKVPDGERREFTVEVQEELWLQLRTMLLWRGCRWTKSPDSDFEQALDAVAEIYDDVRGGHEELT